MEVCTLIGAEDSTDLDELWALSAKYPFVEWGVLLCVTSPGVGRYPTLEWIKALGGRLNETSWPKRPRFSVHVVGRAAKEFINNDWTVTHLAQPFDRIQLNFRAEHFRVDQIEEVLRRHYPKTIITQFNEGNEHLAPRLKRYKNHQIVFDRSDGKGLGCFGWHDPIPGVRCGYTGGLGPENIVKHLLDIDETAGGQPYWISMASRLRGAGDKFDVNKAEMVLRRVANTVATRQICPWQEEAIGRYAEPVVEV